MPTYVRMVAKLEEPAELLSDRHRTIALFIGIELAALLIAIASGVQGVWL
jgi:hypothetical protein